MGFLSKFLRTRVAVYNHRDYIGGTSESAFRQRFGADEF